MDVIDEIRARNVKGKKLNDLLMMGFEKGDDANSLVWTESNEEPDWCNDMIKVHFEKEKLFIDSIEISTRRGEEKWKIMMKVIGMDDTLFMEEASE